MLSINSIKKIKIQMIRKDISAAEIARRVKVNRSAITQTIHGLIKSRRLRTAIASSLNIPYRKIWKDEK